MRFEVGAAAFALCALTSAGVASAQSAPPPATTAPPAALSGSDAPAPTTLPAKRARPRAHEPNAAAPPPPTAANPQPSAPEPAIATVPLQTGATPTAATQTAATQAAAAQTAATQTGAAQTGAAPAAHDSEAARPLFEAGRRAYEAGRYAEALDAFQRVFVQTGDAAMLIHVADAHEQLAEPGRAAAALQQHLALEPEAPNRAELEHRIAELEGAPLAAQPNVAAQAPPPASARDDGLIAGRTFTWVALGTSLAFGAAAGLVWMNANQSFEHLALTCGMDGTCSDDQVATVSGGVTATNVCLAASGAALALALVLFFVEGDSSPSERAPASNPNVAANVGTDGATLSLTGQL